VSAQAFDVLLKHLIGDIVLVL